MAGTEFQTGKVLQPIANATPLGIGLNSFFKVIELLPIGFSHDTSLLYRVNSWYAVAMASSARSEACGPEAWNAIMKLCPVVWIVAKAISKNRILILSKASIKTWALVSIGTFFNSVFTDNALRIKFLESWAGYFIPNGLRLTGLTSSPIQSTFFPNSRPLK